MAFKAATDAELFLDANSIDRTGRELIEITKFNYACVGLESGGD